VIGGELVAAQKTPARDAQRNIIDSVGAR
jgi:hypothetical protein